MSDPMDTNTAATTMHTPPECQGQIVTVSYGDDGEYAYRRVFDASDRSESWSRICWADAWAATPEGADIDYEPWNSEPAAPGGLAWEPCSAPAE